MPTNILVGIILSHYRNMSRVENFQQIENQLDFVITNELRIKLYKIFEKLDKLKKSNKPLDPNTITKKSLEELVAYFDFLEA